MRKFSLCGSRGEAETVRSISLNSGAAHETYLDNFTRTTKYTLITFLPKALFEQYRRVANIYFTIVAALSLTEFSPVRPWTTWTPLVLVLGVSIIKEAVEDYKRYKADNEVNNRAVQVLDPGSKQFVTRRWMDVRVGEIIIIHKDEYVPADVLFLSSEQEEGTCYVETMNLDGETNLKIKKALDETKDFKHATFADFTCDLQCEPPNSRLYQFTGNLLLPAPVARKVPISPAAIILRGCSLRNTERIFGAVIYAGHESKIFKNSTQAPSKRSTIERIVDKIIIFMFSLLFSMCICGCIYYGAWVGSSLDDAWYLAPWEKAVGADSSKPVTAGITNFITVFILYGYLIPISLYVSMEMVKIVQSMVFIAADLSMYHAETDTPALARTSNLNEELGMVNTVLSDKTGTLTRNVMEFFKCSVAGISYGTGVTEIERSNAARKGLPIPRVDTTAGAVYRESFFNFYDARMLGGAWTKQPDTQTIEMFWRLLAVCHTVIPDGPQTQQDIKYEAESPDEAALVVAAKVCGFFFYKRTNTAVYVREHTAQGTRNVQYEVLNILEFNSTRKRMSVIVQSDEGKLILFCKGADTVIYERLDHKHPQNAAYKEATTAHMEEYGSAGLRTLCLAYMELDPDFYQTWQQKFVEAKTSMTDRDAKEGVPQCIKQMADGGIRLWVLTGDKMETAINIGFACSLITDEQQQFIVTAYFADVDEMEMAGHMEEAAKLANQRVEEQLRKVAATMKENGRLHQYALVIDGKALSYALSDRLSALFLEVGLQCAAVICCRVSPLQKALVTGLVRSHGDVTLAIGDGANDVGMIQRAHIGVGISGQEGMQAVMSADFAIAQFRYLTPLLMVHGRWNYKRLTRMINFFFYKNLLFGITIFCFNAFTAFSGQYLYNDFYMTLFNVIFTALTPIVIGMFDRDLDRNIALRYPQLYKQGQNNTYFGFWQIAGWLFTSTYQAAVIMVLVLVGCGSHVISHPNGQPFTMWETGVLMFSVVVVTVHFQVAQVEEQWTWLHHLSIWLSQAVWWLYLLAYGAFPLSLASDLYHLFLGIVAGNPQYWLYLLLIPIACQLPDFFWRQIRRLVAPDNHHILQELMLLERRQGGVARTVSSVREPVAGKDDLMDTKAIGLRVFGNKQNINTGYVPPYHRDSRYYNFRITNPWKGSHPSATAMAAPVTTSPKHDKGSAGLLAQAENPVLRNLDQELTVNPMRGRARQPGHLSRVVAGAGQHEQGSQPVPHSIAVAEGTALYPEDVAMLSTYAAVLYRQPRS
ncbi:phospholipid-transporting ATPase [Haematococcus lacustris]|uniref:Phospholipid-transporting ATPase n=1 Tax=Haematococcus lacustris TaxID=44745 RepID=A0A699YX46_HAELA|nr:phospholipid-transporting ATPase [Haematococcus lacustris]